MTGKVLYEEKDKAFEIGVDKMQAFTEGVFAKKGGVLFLTNNSCTLELFDWFDKREDVILFSEKITYQQVVEMQPRFIVSYNYVYMISEDIISYMQGNIINMHISYLPWNRGFSPNIWSFIDNTPKGVTIHQINNGLDKGRILYQKECFFDIKEETFVSTYKKLNIAITDLFKEHWEEIKTGKYILKEQVGKGTYHSKKDLYELQSKVPFEWSDNIAEFLEKYYLIVK